MQSSSKEITSRFFASYWTLFVVSVSLALVGVYFTREYLMDDAMITLRYSYHLARLGWPVWNPADLVDPSMGYTSLAWMLLNSIPALFISNQDVLVLVAKLFSLLALLAIVAIFTRSISDLAVALPVKYLIAILIFTQFGYGFHVNSAMETMMFSYILLLAARAYIQGSFRAAYFWGGVAFLVRPEGAAVVGLMVAWDVFHERYRQAVVAGLLFTSLVLTTVGLLYSWYGDVLPNTFYAKQDGLNLDAVMRTGLFLITLAFPFLLLSLLVAFRERNASITFMLVLVGLYLLYYSTVDPVMNVLSRYQWPSFVLITYASFSAVDWMKSRLAANRFLIIGLLAAVAILNIGNGLGATYFSNSTGHAMQNLIRIGKALATHQDPEKWLLYHDAGAVVYFSGWNTHESIGLTNASLVKGEITLSDLYKKPEVAIVLRNFDLMSDGQQEKHQEFNEMMDGYGYLFVEDISILKVPNQRNFVVAMYARDPDFARLVLSDLQVDSLHQPNFSYLLYHLVRQMVRGE